MRKTFCIGDMVELTASCKAQCSNPGKYEFGVVTSVGTRGVVYVRWNGIDHTIGMKDSEIQLLESEV